MNRKHIIYIMNFILFALSSAILLTIVCKPLFYWQISAVDTQQLIGLTQTQVMKNYDQLIDYLLFPWINTLIMSDIPTSAQGAFHFMEVKNLFLLNQIVFIFTLIIFVMGLKKIHKTQSFWQYVTPLRLLSYIPLLLTIIFVSSFNYWFVAFHHMFFNNDAWLFNPATDPIINVLPESFFMLCFIVVVAIVQSWFLIGYLYMKRKTRQLVDKRVLLSANQ
ncbi:TIGR01906 family membrane protein [Granulicatella sp. 19428wC4_WM01]|nr:TIGR01906 family membrane protein [Granulicatella sp. 19428wC4_WM01]